MEDNDIKKGYFWLDYLLKNKYNFLFKKNSSLKTNIDFFDRFLNGLTKQQFYVLAARPSVGKTTLSLNIIINAIKSLKEKEIIVFFSLEMSAVEILNRINVLIESQKEIINIQKIINSKKLLIVDFSGLNVKNIRNTIENLKETYEIKAIFIDHLQLLELDKITSNAPRYEKIAKITRDLKILAKEKNINVFALSQLSRDFEKRDDKIPFLSDLRDSGTIEQDADVVIFLAKNKNNYILYIAKNRNGSCAQVICNFEKEKFLFTFETIYEDDDEKTR
ncbi:DnaB-like helicase C-terminal domain-containing protein [Metamycoplasma hyosynoviae]|uniref:DnaB-like helicase C-terminal domain-containing protein n=1 Tax=Metamycoplasma hyosynoviae TaxID=29559 RepID=UPI0023595837|nr:DnaB-like helicase C-terminal domain-containing protein [Metamycoplasma hyosynoviae]MDC8920552.1 DnaB-like helicase C-terminal domain-containing protein [Metamycoplasma hyosynoviae]MDD1366398.1 DnaB-like helicase C-terminal domain-containing protein [Metamycoplasma hyosynoviae]MDD1373920.1 DnaB-like helicase C-terminal domain-containing protein [Metamycoplasma hyosynoviae]MDD1375400.1 DnaB-like helicase C-terminal domain-containing protein [Metamycoplasma hyosynoviae]MDD1377004.1 DnaB-like 